MERRLGRGLDYLLSGDLAADGDQLLELDVHSIVPNPFQPRTEFDEGELDELAASIVEHGVIQPVIVRRTPTGYELVAGERRLRASKLAGRDRVPAIVRGANDTQMLELALIENIQREDLSPIEVARGYAAYIERLDLTQQEAASRLGKSRSGLANTLRLLDLPADVQELVSAGDISAGHARALLAISDVEQQREIARRVIAEGLSVREVERLVREEPSAKRPARSERPAPTPHQVDVQDRLQQRLGTKVRLRPSKEGRGRIVIEYFTEGDLQRLVDVLLAD